jgi:hypothetical protein
MVIILSIVNEWVRTDRCCSWKNEWIIGSIKINFIRFFLYCNVYSLGLSGRCICNCVDYKDIISLCYLFINEILGEVANNNARWYTEHYDAILCVHLLYSSAALGSALIGSSSSELDRPPFALAESYCPASISCCSICCSVLASEYSTSFSII